MDIGKIVGWSITILFVLFLFWLGGIVLNIGLGVIGLVGTTIGSLIKLVFSNNFLLLATIGVVAYLCWNRKQCPYQH